ncbi:hypothetical protein D3C76_1188530 [compost metagenome]
MQNVGHLGANLDYFSAHAFQTLFDQRFQCGAFAFASHNEVIQCTIQRLHQLCADGVQILLLSRHHARPTQDVDRIDFPFVALHFDPVGGFNQLLGQFFVQDHRTLRARIQLKAQVALHFAAGQTTTNAFADHRFQAAELFRQTDVGFQIALVNGTQLPSCAAPFTLDFSPSVGCHAADH